jgi:predicted hydrocarbon binding protein
VSAPGFNDRLVRDLETGEIRDGDIRYLMLRADALMGVLRRLPVELRGTVLAAFKDSIVEHGSRSAKGYQASLPPDQQHKLLDVIAATAPQLGWGRWRFLDVSSDGLTLEVHNSPFAKGYGSAEHGVCHPIAGMLTAVGGMVLGRPVVAEETHCGAHRGSHTCRFSAKVSA